MYYRKVLITLYNGGSRIHLQGEDNLITLENNKIRNINEQFNTL